MDKNKQRRAILALLKTGGWHDTKGIIKAAGGATEATRRLRELRKQGHKVLCACFGQNFYMYKLERK